MSHIGGTVEGHLTTPGKPHPPYISMDFQEMPAPCQEMETVHVLGDKGKVGDEPFKLSQGRVGRVAGLLADQPRRQL